MMLPLFALRVPTGYAILTTVGRRSKKTRRKCVRAIRKADTVYLVMLRPPVVAAARPSTITAWVWNIRADPRVRLRVRDGSFEGVARELKGADELREAREAFCEPVNPVDYGECKLHLRGLPSRSKIREVNRYWFDTGVPLAVDLGAEESAHR